MGVATYSLGRSSKYPPWNACLGFDEFPWAFNACYFRGVYCCLFQGGWYGCTSIVVGRWESKVTMFVFSICSFLGENVILSFLYQKASTWIATSLFCVFFQEPEPVFGRLRMKNEALQVPATNLLSREICSCFGNFAHPGNKNHQESLPLK